MVLLLVLSLSVPGHTQPRMASTQKGSVDHPTLERVVEIFLTGRSTCMCLVLGPEGEDSCAVVVAHVHKLFSCKSRRRDTY